MLLNINFWTKFDFEIVNSFKIQIERWKGKAVSQIRTQKGRKIQKPEKCDQTLGIITNITQTHKECFQKRAIKIFLANLVAYKKCNKEGSAFRIDWKYSQWVKKGRHNIRDQDGYFRIFITEPRIQFNWSGILLKEFDWYFPPPPSFTYLPLSDFI